MTTHRKQCVTAIVTLLITLGLVGVSFAPNLPGYEFPQATALVAAVLAAVLVLTPKRPATPAGEDVIPWGVVWPMLLMLFAFLMVMQWLGFFATSFITFLLIALVYSPQRLSVRRVIRTTAIAVLFMGGLYLIFVMLLRVQFPSGVLI